MSETNTTESAGGPKPPRRTIITRSETGAVMRWDAPPAEKLGDSIPGLKVKALCGVGGMGAVYRAEQARLGRTVAVKILPAATAPDQEARERFEREARILSTMNHPNVLGIHDFGSLEDGTLYLVTEWAAGGDLAKLMGGRAHPPAEVQVWVRQIAAALTAAHAQGIIHRDLKPANVLVLADGRLTLGDFGLAHAGGGGFSAALTTPGALFGTFEYMAPEQMESVGRVTPATDLYSLGVMTYQMLTGRVPRGAYARPSRLARVPAEVDAFLEAALATDPARRPQSAVEFVRRFDFACGAPRRRERRQLICLATALIGFTLAWARSEIIRAEREAMRAESRAAAVGEALTAAHAAGAAFRPEPAVREGQSSGPGQISETAPAPTSFATPEPMAPPPESSAPPAPASAPAGQGAERREGPWISLLPELKPAEQSQGGEWTLVQGRLVSGEGRCVLSLPVKPAASYDLAVEFTRDSGKGSVALFLPTLSGVGTFEVDAWGLGIAGLQLVDGADMRRQNRHFPTPLKNGEMHRVVIEVRGERVAVAWDGELRMSWALEGRHLRIAPLWQTRPEMGVGVGSWMSPTTFHRITYRPLPAGTEK